MTLGRLFAFLIVVAVTWWVVTKSGLLARHEPEPEQSQAPPIERAREVARKSAERNAARQGAQNEADSAAPGGSVTENMTPDQVRSLLGPPSDVQSETSDSGARREKWIYATAGKTVVFENGVVVSIQ